MKQKKRTPRLHKSDIEVGQVYTARITGKLARVRITGDHPRGGFQGINLETDRFVRVKSAGNLRIRDIEAEKENQNV